MDEFILGGLAASSACLISNPFEVVKTRMQMQGELQPKTGAGTSVSMVSERPYSNAFSAAYQIAKHEGVSALQKGLIPAVAFQFVMNGLRLGAYQTMDNLDFNKDIKIVPIVDEKIYENLKKDSKSFNATAIANPNNNKNNNKNDYNNVTEDSITKGNKSNSEEILITTTEIEKDENDTISPPETLMKRRSTQRTKTETIIKEISIWKNILCSSTAGAIGSVVGSPLQLVKTNLQIQSNSTELAVGHQNSSITNKNMIQILHEIYTSHGVKGLWRGVSAVVPRVMVGSAVQIPSFTFVREKIGAYFKENNYKENLFLVPILSSLTASLATVIAMQPLDVVSTRLYNQPVDSITGKGKLYQGVLDCLVKIVSTEGFLGLYKGISAHYFRLGPHSILSLTLWDVFRNLWKQFPKD